MIISGGSGFNINGVTFSVSNAVPGAPTINSVSTGAFASGQMTLCYTPPSCQGYPGKITSYVAYSRPGCISTSTTSTSSITVKGLSARTCYTFKIQAVNCQGAGCFGYYCIPNAVAGYTPPCAPIMCGASPGNTAGTVVVYYCAPIYNGGQNITSYTAVSNPPGYTATRVGSAAAITVTGLPQGYYHTFTVYATNPLGNSVASSASNTVITPGPTFILSNLLISGGGGGGYGRIPGVFNGGGGGAGGVSTFPVTVQKYLSYPVIVGAGGVRGSSSTFATQGGRSTFNCVGVCGGGYGGGGYYGGGGGYSGAGSGGGGAGSTCAGPGGAGEGFGHAGGAGSITYKSGGGGGGWRTSGSCGASVNGGWGGYGSCTTIISTSMSISWSIGQFTTATNRIYFAGGGGGGYCGGYGASFGFCGGGNGGYPGVPGVSGKLYSGGGGGGGGSNYTSKFQSGGDGGSGVVIFGYTGTTQIFGGGNIIGSFISSGTTHWAHIFTSSGILTSYNSALIPTLNTASLTAVPGQVLVSYTAPSCTGGYTITSYGAISTPGSFVGTQTGACLSTITMNGLPPGSYTFKVYATTAAGNTAYSVCSNALLVGFAGSPTCVVASPTNTIGQALISYVAPSSNGGYLITGYTANSNRGSYTGSTGSGAITISGLTTGSVYSFKVHATNSAGNGVCSACSNLIKIGTPGAPTIGTASTTTTAGQVIISYTAPSGNGGYPITGYTAISTPGSFVGTQTGACSGTITVNGLLAANTYTFKVYAINAAGNGPYSACSNSVSMPISGYPVSYLLVGGGGGGGGGLYTAPNNRWGGGGGGGGGFTTGTVYVNPGSSYPVIVGAGGSVGLSGAPGANGISSSFNSITAVGGGGGGGAATPGTANAGGSGGGGGRNSSGGAGTPGQGYPGGTGICGSGGGGGGASANGLNYQNATIAGNGGAGKSSTIVNGVTAVTYAGGGGGAGGATNPNVIGTAGAGGAGGGGKGGYRYCSSTYAGIGGTVNSGGGGGGSAGPFSCGSAPGGSGVVVISYINATQLGTGGTVSSYCSSGVKHWVHKFTTSTTYVA